MKQRLNLPKIESRPPCPPRIYKKLYQFLDKALPAKLPVQSTSTPATPTKTGRNKAQPSTPRTTAQPTTPSTRGTGRKRKIEEVDKHDKQLAVVDDGTLPDWVGMAVKHICKQVGVPAAMPHIYVGLYTLLRDAGGEEPMPKRSRAQSMKKDAGEAYTAAKLPALICALLAVVVQKLQGEQTSSDELIASTVAELATLGRVVEQDVDNVLDQTDEYLDKHNEQWQQMAWYTNIRGGEEEGVQEESDVDDMHDGIRASKPSTSGKTEAGGRASALGTMQYGLGTMMQEKIDWLSAERRANYATWEAKMLKEIERIEQAQHAQQQQEKEPVAV